MHAPFVRFLVAFTFVSTSIVAGCDCGHSHEHVGVDAGDDGGAGDSSIDSGMDAGSDAGQVNGGCPVYTTPCNGGCIPSSVDALNCGGCGVTCTGADSCSAGACSATCLSGQYACNNSCVDWNTSNVCCGNGATGTGTSCGPGQGCSDGVCVTSLITAAPPASCANGGPPIVLGSTSATCLAMTSFTWGVCSCEGMHLSQTLATDAYASGAGPYVPGGLGGGVGTNQDLTSSSSTNVSGVLWCATGIDSSNSVDVGLDLRSGALAKLKTGSVGGDAFVNGNLTTNGAPNSFTITGDLHVPSASTTVSSGVAYANRIDGPVDVPPPCDCNPANFIDVAGIVAARQSSNDNSLIGLMANATTSPASAVRIDLPCGNFYLDAVTGSKDVTIVAHGNTALYVGGDVNSSGSFRVTVDPGFSLDVLVAGDLHVSAPSSFGSPNYPAMTRVYIGGANGFTISAQSLFGAFFWSGNGPVTTSQTLEIFGGLFAESLVASAAVDVHYDRTVVDLPGGSACSMTPPSGCTTCGDCGNQACVQGECGGCTFDSDCCAPLKCNQGLCSILLE